MTCWVGGTGALLVYLCCCRKPRAKVDKHAAPKAEKPVAKEGPPAVPKEERKKESPKTALSKSSPPKAPIATSAPDGKKGDPPAPSTPPGVTPAPAVDTASPETDGALTRAHSESTTKKTNLVPYSEYRKKRLQNIRKESGLDGTEGPLFSGRGRADGRDYLVYLQLVGFLFFSCRLWHFYACVAVVCFVCKMLPRCLSRCHACCHACCHAVICLFWVVHTGLDTRRRGRRNRSVCCTRQKCGFKVDNEHMALCNVSGCACRQKRLARTRQVDTSAHGGRND